MSAGETFKKDKPLRFPWLRSRGKRATKQDLDEMEKRIMSAISDYAAKVNASFDAIEAGVMAANTSLTGLVDDVAYLKEVIDKLQNNPGPISPEDQALLDSAQARTDALGTRVEAFRAAIGTLDAATDRPAVP